ncbi:helix-turn-helix transcriptional regulator [Pelagovum pacificum]|uniref:YafY family transcriptional regulator n=1 Tax=Pelagovum pacificum TaxID=2588711 RepID=A0A5C5GF22_9RHOB|nr:YafY family protein [Pelagovum pacificum]QQA43545.1 YafY family transcriptional regulator [Pelagovum pacificum]TNY33318.1 YafY family transcriptional regulator [Pelagovum pacificum]
MARSDRLLRLLQAMRVMPAPITASRLAEETGVSLRSLYRDIDSLRAAGARIEGERGYGYRLVEDFALPPQTLDRDEIEALALGLAEVQRMGDPTLARAAASVLAKVGARLPEGHEQQLIHAISQVYRPDSRLSSSADLDLIRAACWQERALRLRYIDRDGEATERDIYPLSLMYTERTLTVLAWCCLREDFRMFRSDRIEAAEDAGRSFRPARAALLRNYLARLRSREEAKYD